LLELAVFDTSYDEWQAVLDYLSANFAIAYSEDGVVLPLPRFEEIRRKRNQRTVMLEILLSGLTLNCHFLDDDHIQLNILPEDVDSSEKADLVFRLMSGLANLLNKEVLLVPEFLSASRETLQKLAVCSVAPGTNEIRLRRG